MENLKKKIVEFRESSNIEDKFKKAEEVLELMYYKVGELHNIVVNQQGQIQQLQERLNNGGYKRPTQ